ncbi:phage holin [Bacillus licheniformis]|uniref:phage holin n=1 Tax=Bacillus licheniformis TaxID=1402 RepID=UPI000374175E|nr:phage holin [Bacillus licheniformis]KAA0813185.1 phage holin [Bacillus licheniformis]KAA0821374.1 phage holin [Bacillus licheniformis]KAA0826366.1 phage holin [Bacillus licheniformis]MBU8781464.1 phage holin [Bacillus licheniformis]MBU8799591.1 phage holin [Bacillus licheniformis]
MTKINWKVRLNNKLFLTALASQTAVMIQGIIAGLVGLGIMDIDLSQLDNSLKISLGIVDTVLIYLSFLGIIKDPTTKGISDSDQAMDYEEPRQ